MDTEGFKVPHTIPQDLLLIQELIGNSFPVQNAPTVLSPTTSQTVAPVSDPSRTLIGSREEGTGGNEEDISSSDDEGDRVKTISLSTEEEDEEDEVAALIDGEAAIGGTLSDGDELTAETLRNDDVVEENKAGPLEPAASSSDNASSSDTSSDSDSDSEDQVPKTKPTLPAHFLDNDNDLDDDDDDNPTAMLSASNAYFYTKNEVPETEAPFTVPEIEKVGDDEVLEKVGEVMNVLESTGSVIVRGLPADGMSTGRAQERALDTDTLLVFEDRRVLGYIFETFGPTSQPYYLIKFRPTRSNSSTTADATTTTAPSDPPTSTPPPPQKSKHSLDAALLTPGRPIFHVPARSKFIFVSQLKALGKGSDASNVHDEEPGEDDAELFFSDDEKEAEWRAGRRKGKRKRDGSRARSSSVFSSTYSRQSTPNPTFMMDQELAAAEADTYISRNPYDEHGPYDIDYSTGAGPSNGGVGRRRPLAYDDPYGEAYTAPDVADRERERDGRVNRREGIPAKSGGERGRGGGGYGSRGRGRDHHGRDHHRGRGRGRGRGGYSQPYQQQQQPQRYPEPPPSSMSDAYDDAIARATGYDANRGGTLQANGYNEYQPLIPGFSYGGSSTEWGYTPFQQQQDYGYGGSNGTMPHINPRFASALSALTGTATAGYGLDTMPAFGMGTSAPSIGFGHQEEQHSTTPGQNFNNQNHGQSQ